MSLRLPTKHPAAQVGYPIDLSEIVAPGDSIASVEPAFDPNDGVLQAWKEGSLNGTVYTFWVEGGADPQDYTTPLTVTFASGGILVFEVFLLVSSDLADPTTP